MVYSTCSMNPIENEAVIASVIERCGGSSKIEIVDCSDKLPGLKRSPGLAKWSVMDKSGATWHNFNDVQESVKAGNEVANKLGETMFPPVAEDPGVDLTRCTRVYAHQQDTGCFFIAVLEKKSEIKTKPEKTSKQGASTPAAVVPVEKENEMTDQPGKAPDTPPSEEAASLPTKRKPDGLDDEQAVKKQKVLEESTETSAQSTPLATNTETAPAKSTAPVTQQPPKKKIRRGQPTEEPFTYVDPNSEEIQHIFNFYEIAPQFPRDRFLVRNADGRLARTVYYSSALARDILSENQASGIKFVHGGVKMFVKQDVQHEDVCPWRIQTDGLQILESWVGNDRVLKIYKRETLRKLLIEMFPKVSDGAWKELGEIGEWAKDADMGCCVLRLEPTDNDDGFK